jgi:hypothetical protein
MDSSVTNSPWEAVQGALASGTDHLLKNAIARTKLGNGAWNPWRQAVCHQAVLEASVEEEQGDLA